MMQIQQKQTFMVYFLFDFSFMGGSDLQRSAKLCSCGNEEYVKMWEIQGCQLKQIKLSPALRSEHTHGAHTRRSRHATHKLTHKHTHKCTKQPFTTFHLFCSSQENLIKSRITYSRVQRGRPLQMGLEVKDRKRVKAEGKSRQGMREKKRLVISLLAKRCERGDQWEPAELQQHSGLSARWEQGGGAKRRLTCLLLEE